MPARGGGCCHPHPSLHEARSHTNAHTPTQACAHRIKLEAAAIRCCSTPLHTALTVLVNGTARVPCPGVAAPAAAGAPKGLGAAAGVPKRPEPPAGAGVPKGEAARASKRPWRPRQLRVNESPTRARAVCPHRSDGGGHHVPESALCKRMQLAGNDAEMNMAGQAHLGVPRFHARAHTSCPHIGA